MQKRSTSPSPISTAFYSTAVQIFAQCRLPLRKWFKKAARSLPWREPIDTAGQKKKWSDLTARRSPYAVWVSEIMLQQTQVAAVVPYFQNWMARFPTVEALARASEEEVLRAWAGLGYYARARNLHRGAQKMVSLEKRPVTVEEWERIPGIGPYTAGAIVSLAFGMRAPILDGNVVRVFSRLLGLDFLPGKGTAEKHLYWELARLWADAAQPGELNEALMELGALVCTPVNPECARCPLPFSCSALQGGRQNELPPVKPRARVEEVSAVALRAVSGGKVLVETRAPGSFLAGHAMFPLFHGAEAPSWRATFQQRHPGLKIVEARPAHTFRHAIMAKRYVVTVWELTVVRNAAYEPTVGSHWFPEPEADRVLTNALARKIWTRP